jgi:hypothetical protein
MTFVSTSDSTNVLAFSRGKNGDLVLSVFNLSSDPVKATVQIDKPGDYDDYFSGEIITLGNDAEIDLGKWGYRILIKK